MLSNNTRKLYIVNDFKSDNIEQVIFILKANRKNNTTDIATEAQSIINNYAKKINGYSSSCNIIAKKEKKSSGFLKFIGIFSAISIFAYLLFLYING